MNTVFFTKPHTHSTPLISTCSGVQGVLGVLSTGGHYIVHCVHPVDEVDEVDPPVEKVDPPESDNELEMSDVRPQGVVPKY